MWIMRPLLTLVLGIIGLMLASWCFAGVDHPSLVTDPSLITLINTTGDDVFATTNLTTLLDPTGNGTQHYGPYTACRPTRVPAETTGQTIRSTGISPSERIPMVRSWWSSSSRTVAS